MQMSLQYPLSMSFKIIAIAPQIYITDAAGQSVLYVKMKALRFKEEVNVYTDDTKSNELYQINADRVIDFSAKYNFSARGQAVGAIKRKGLRSLFKAEYLVSDAADVHSHTITEDNVAVRLMDMLLNQIPIVNMFTGFLFHPSYTAAEANSQRGIMQVKKQAAFFEGKFTIEKLDPTIDAETEQRLLLSFLMMTLLERSRG